MLNEMEWLNEIRNFLEDYSSVYSDNPDIDIFKDMGIKGDDFHEMINTYAEKYGIDMTDYLWYFHCNEEGHSIGKTFITTPYEKVKRIPVTPKILASFIETKKWKVDYT